MNRVAWRNAACVAMLAVSVVRADDVVVDGPGNEEPGVAQGMVFVGGGADLVQMFDSQAFADGQGFGEAQVIVNGQARVLVNGQWQEAEQPPGDNDAVVVQRLEPVRQRLEARITTVDRIVGLDEKQRKKLEIAAQSDLRRLTDTVAEARAKYAGKTLKMDPRTGDFDAEARKAMAEVQQDAARCRELVGQAAGAGSLLAKVITGTLDEPQATKYKAVMDGRRDCRWKAAVATVLAQLDDTLGLTQKQHDALTAALLAAPPSAEELANDGPAQPAPAVALAATRLAAALGGNEKLAAVLDPRQRAVVAAGIPADAWQAFPQMAVPGIQMIVD